MKYRIRKKKDKYILQKFEGDKWKSRTLKPSKALWECLCPTKSPPIVSEKTHESIPNKNERFVESSLSELNKEDILPSEEDLEEIKRKLWEWSK